MTTPKKQPVRQSPRGSGEWIWDGKSMRVAFTKFGPSSHVEVIEDAGGPGGGHAYVKVADILAFADYVRSVRSGGAS